MSFNSSSIKVSVQGGKGPYLYKGKPFVLNILMNVWPKKTR